MPDLELLNRLPAAGLIETRDFVYRTVGPNVIIVLLTTDAVRRFARHNTETPLKIRKKFFRSMKGTRVAYGFVDMAEPLIDEGAALDLISHEELIPILTVDTNRQDYTWRDSPPPRFADPSPM